MCMSHKMAGHKTSGSLKSAEPVASVYGPPTRHENAPNAVPSLSAYVYAPASSR